LNNDPAALLAHGARDQGRIGIDHDVSCRRSASRGRSAADKIEEAGG
jgi:hypothetical protein